MAERSQDTRTWDNDGELILTGSSNAYEAETARPITGYHQGLRICGKANHTNTGAATLNVNGMGAVAIRKLTSVALVAGDMVSGQYYDFVYDFTNGWFQLLSVGSGFVRLTGDIMSGALEIQAGDSTSALNFLIVKPTDFGTDKPQLSLYKGVIANQWHIGLFDGVDNGGTLDFISALLTHNGIAVQEAGKQSIWVPAGAMTPYAGAGAGVLNIGGGGGVLPYIAFDPVIVEGAAFSIAMPKSWNEGTLTARVHWMHPATATNFQVAWLVQGYAASNDDTLTADLYAGPIISDTGGTTSDLYISDEGGAITLGGTPNEGDLAFFRVLRDPNNDNLAVDAYLIGVMLFYTTNAPNDA